ncbi:uncharacterized protein JCM6883_005108 [Sporobolomyces salmoneus]|uniref:uncharacterized protein n=1 Tax=Sporobolomyces salmoneus TaxID=183962 RepID=UPI00317F35E6
MDSTDLSTSSLLVTPSKPTLNGLSNNSPTSHRTPPSASPRQSITGTTRGNRAFRRLSYGSSASPSQDQAIGGGGGGGFTFSPKIFQPVETGTPHDFKGVTDGLETLTLRSVEVSTRRIAKLRETRTRKIERKPSRDFINGLPDELLTKIFSKLNDRQGFKAQATSRGPEWLFPPLKIALVCKRWLPIAQQLFYRSIQIHHVDRIPPLHHTFTTTNLSLAVRHLSIKLPYTAADKLSLPSPLRPPATASLFGSSGREPDSDSDLSIHKSRTKDKKERKPLVIQDQLVALFQSCSQLLSLEIAGVDPLTLFSSSSTPSSSLHHLHQLRLSTISTLFLGGSESSTLTSTTLRQALLALTGLRHLSFRGYVSDSSSPLEFAPTLTTKGSPARPLPLRARRLLKLKSIAIIESSMSYLDLESLFKQVQSGSLEELVVTDYYDGKASLERIRRGQFGGTTIEGLSKGQIVSLIQGSLRILRVTLHNFPLARDVLSATQSSPPPPPRRRLSGAPSPPDPPHVLDRFISSLESLETLDVGGSLVSPALLFPPTHLLPSTVKYLTIRACPALTPSVVLAFLQSLAQTRHSPSSSSPLRARTSLTTLAEPSRLEVLEVFGGSESGWKSGVQSWEVQKACWDVNVRWSGGGKWKPGSSGGGAGEWRMGSVQGHQSW